jgi:hypothetical protein
MLTQSWVNWISIAVVGGGVVRLWQVTRSRGRPRATAKDEQDSLVDTYLVAEHMRHNRAEIERSETCGCVHCEQLYRPAEVTGWVEDDTAVCPRCGVSAVVGSAAGLALTRELLRRARAVQFPGTSSEGRAS